MEFLGRILREPEANAASLAMVYREFKNFGMEIIVEERPFFESDFAGFANLKRCCKTPCCR